MSDKLPRRRLPRQSRAPVGATTACAEWQARYVRRMANTLLDVTRRVFRRGIDSLPASERDVVQRFLERGRISRDTTQAFLDERTFGQRVADRVAAFGGSWTFIGLFAAVLVSWVVLNSLVLARRGDAFDPYPYILLNLFLSMVAALQAPIIMMSQNRQAARDRLEAAHDYEVNLKAELEILGLHEKLDQLREAQWRELVQMQQEQIRLLTQLLEARVPHVHSDAASPPPSPAAPDAPSSDAPPSPA
jgi:uncharacterized membrane protein